LLGTSCLSQILQFSEISSRNFLNLAANQNQILVRCTKPESFTKI